MPVFLLALLLGGWRTYVPASEDDACLPGYWGWDLCYACGDGVDYVLRVVI